MRSVKILLKIDSIFTSRTLLNLDYLTKIIQKDSIKLWNLIFQWMWSYSTVFTYFHLTRREFLPEYKASASWFATVRLNIMWECEIKHESKETLKYIFRNIIFQPKKKTSGTTIHAFTRFDVHPTKYSFTYVVYLCLVSKPVGKCTKINWNDHMQSHVWINKHFV